METILTSTIGFVKSLVSAIGFKGSTQHPDYAQANAISQKFNEGLWAIFNSLKITLSSDFSNAIANWIDGSRWWKEGNDQWPSVPKDIRANANDARGNTWRLGVWAVGNSPSNNLTDAWSAIKQCLDNVLPGYTNNADVVGLVDAYLVSLRDGTTFSLPSPSASSTGIKVVNAVTSGIESFFGSGTTAAGGNNQSDSSSSWITTALIAVAGVGILFGLTLLFKRMKK